jgi:hypothetical protein
MKWLKNFDRLLEIQRNIVWPSVLELDPKQVSSQTQSITTLLKKGEHGQEKMGKGRPKMVKKELDEKSI